MASCTSENYTSTLQGMFGMQNPLALEVICLAKVIINLDQFSSVSLALLPVQLRRCLLYNISPADICWLENTSVANGIDTTAIWEALSKNCTLPGHNYLPNNPDRKSYFFSFISSVLINHIHAANYTTHAAEVIALLFSIKDCLGIDSWNGTSRTHLHLQQQPGLIVPSHYASYFSTDAYSDVQLINIILETTHYFPPTLLVVCERFFDCIQSELWSTKNRDVLVKFLSQIKGLSISHGSEDLSSAIVPTFIMSVLSTSRLQLDALSINCTHHSFFESAVVGFTPYLCGHETSGISCKLKSLTFCCDGAGIADWICYELAQVIESQPTLEEVSLEFHSSPDISITSPGHNYLCQVLTNLICQPKFRYMLLENISITLGNFQRTIHSFLTAPCADEQHLHLEFLKILPNSELDFDKNLMHIGGCAKAVTHKSLHLQYIDLPSAFLRWVEQHVYLHLKTLMLSGDEGYSDDVLSMILNHTRLDIGFLIINGYSPAPHLKSSRCFNRLFENPTLKELQLSAADLGISGHLLDLICGINKQALLGSLMQLDISFNVLGRAPDTELQLLFEGIVSLPQIETFTLTITDNIFNRRQLGIFHKAWEECGRGRRFSCLICFDDIGDLQPTDFAILEDITMDIAY